MVRDGWWEFGKLALFGKTLAIASVEPVSWILAFSSWWNFLDIHFFDDTERVDMLPFNQCHPHWLFSLQIELRLVLGYECLSSVVLYAFSYKLSLLLPVNGWKWGVVHNIFALLGYIRSPIGLGKWELWHQLWYILFNWTGKNTKLNRSCVCVTEFTEAN